ncbi:MAG: hypothetical protein ACREHG_04795, partial [Candidatus Saccharimonadales bacterium]
CTDRFNAVLELCGGLKTALYFFELSAAGVAAGVSSVILADLALALVAEEADLGQSRAECPEPPQNKHR